MKTNSLLQAGKVSVCMATYNGEKYVHDQIASILKQLGPHDELIISDDSSTDNTLGVISAIKDIRIKLFSGNMFRLPTKNFQNALIHASGEFIFLSDQDDVWLDGHYSEMKQLLNDYDLVASNSILVKEDLSVIHSDFHQYFGCGKGILKNIMHSTYFGSCMAFKRSLLLRALPFPDTKEIGHDLWIGLIGELTGKVLFYKKPLLLYRRHESAFTGEKIKSQRTLYKKLRGRVIMFKEIIKFLIKYKWKKD